jgi:hypothetical protein
MKRLLMVVSLIITAVVAQAQTVVFNEDFEGVTLGVTSISMNNNNRALSSEFQVSGQKSDSAVVALSDTTYLLADSFSAFGNSVVLLSFSQICRINFFDASIVEGAPDKGVARTQRTSTEYLGSGRFGRHGNKFASISYSDWLPATDTVMPINVWWENEMLNISYWNNYDGGVVAILEPDTMTAIGDTVLVKVKVTNYGYDTLNTIPLRYTVNGGAPVQETWTAAGQGLAPGDTMIYTFTTTYLSPATQYTVCAYTQISGDVYPNNDQSCKNVPVATPVLDAYVYLIVSPVDTMSFNKPATVTIRIINNGTTALTSIPVQYKVNNNAPVQETWTGTALQYGDSVDYTFTTTIANQPVGSYKLCARTLLAGDQIPYNDERCKQIVITGLGEMVAANNMKLWQNVPNPASAQTLIGYEIPKGGKVIFKMYNMMGEQVMSREYKRNAGKHNIKIDASTMTSGVYFYSIEFDGERLTKRMLITK